MGIQGTQIKGMDDQKKYEKILNILDLITKKNVTDEVKKSALFSFQQYLEQNYLECLKTLIVFAANNKNNDICMFSIVILFCQAKNGAPFLSEQILYNIWSLIEESSISILSNPFLKLQYKMMYANVLSFMASYSFHELGNPSISQFIISLLQQNPSLGKCLIFSISEMLSIHSSYCGIEPTVIFEILYIGLKQNELFDESLRLFFAIVRVNETTELHQLFEQLFLQIHPEQIKFFIQLMTEFVQKSPSFFEPHLPLLLDKISLFVKLDISDVPQQCLTFLTAFCENKPGLFFSDKNYFQIIIQILIYGISTIQSSAEVSYEEDEITKFNNTSLSAIARDTVYAISKYFTEDFLCCYLEIFQEQFKPSTDWHILYAHLGFISEIEYSQICQLVKNNMEMFISLSGYLTQILQQPNTPPKLRTACFSAFFNILNEGAEYSLELFNNNIPIIPLLLAIVTQDSFYSLFDKINSYNCLIQYFSSITSQYIFKQIFDSSHPYFDLSMTFGEIINFLEESTEPIKIRSLQIKLIWKMIANQQYGISSNLVQRCLELLTDLMKSIPPPELQIYIISVFSNIIFTFFRSPSSDQIPLVFNYFHHALELLHCETIEEKLQITLIESINIFISCLSSNLIPYCEQFIPHFFDLAKHEIQILKIETNNNEDLSIDKREQMEIDSETPGIKIYINSNDVNIVNISIQLLTTCSSYLKNAFTPYLNQSLSIAQKYISFKPKIPVLKTTSILFLIHILNIIKTMDEGPAFVNMLLAQLSNLMDDEMDKNVFINIWQLTLEIILYLKSLTDSIDISPFLSNLQNALELFVHKLFSIAESIDLLIKSTQKSDILGQNKLFYNNDILFQDASMITMLFFYLPICEYFLQQFSAPFLSMDNLNNPILQLPILFVLSSLYIQTHLDSIFTLIFPIISTNCSSSDMKISEYSLYLLQKIIVALPITKDSIGAFEESIKICTSILSKFESDGECESINQIEIALKALTNIMVAHHNNLEINSETDEYFDIFDEWIEYLYNFNDDDIDTELIYHLLLNTLELNFKNLLSNEYYFSRLVVLISGYLYQNINDINQTTKLRILRFLKMISEKPEYHQELEAILLNPASDIIILRKCLEWATNLDDEQTKKLNELPLPVTNIWQGLTVINSNIINHVI